MTTIDHQQAATVAAAKALFVMQHRVAVEKFELNSYAALSEAATREASNALQAAEPHLRAAWAAEIRAAGWEGVANHILDLLEDGELLESGEEVIPSA